MNLGGADTLLGKALYFDVYDNDTEVLTGRADPLTTVMFDTDTTAINLGCCVIARDVSEDTLLP